MLGFNQAFHLAIEEGNGVCVDNTVILALDFKVVRDEVDRSARVGSCRGLGR